MLNAQRTTYAILTPGRQQSPTLKIVLNNVTVQNVEDTKFLGCFLDEKLDAQFHGEEVEKKLNALSS